MRRRRRTIGALAAAVAASAALAVGLSPAGAEPADPPTYEATIVNLTGGQALTPPLVTTHRRPHDLFRVGRDASGGLIEIAENGNLAPMIARLAGEPTVISTEVAGVPLVPAADPGGTGLPDRVTITIDGAPGATRLSWASMLICTNDGFTGVDGLRLPAAVGETTVAATSGYDAGSEANTEDFADIVPPCQGLIGVSSSDPGTGMSDPALATDDVIAHHPGIAGGDDLLAGVHGWSDPVATISVTRID